MRQLTLIAGLGALLLPAGGALAGEFETRLDMGLELRIFPESPAFDEQRYSTASPALFLEGEIFYETDDGNDRFKLKPYAKLDAHDDNRTHVDLREANWLHLGETYETVVGLGKVFWGVAESRHLVDIVNQSDTVEDLDNEDKLGQPMAQFIYPHDIGTFEAFVLPGFRERTFPDREARLRGGLKIADEPTYDTSNEEYHVDFAVRFSGVFGDFDVGLSHFHGTSREPRLLPTVESGSGATVLRPHYDQIDQTGIDVQYTTDAWLWKFEAIGRGGHGDYFPAMVAGFEYTLYQVYESDADLGLLAEYLYDGRQDNGDAPGTPFQNDVFLGTRLALNDEQDTSFLAGAIVDLETASTFLSFEAERRIGDTMKLEVESRIPTNIDHQDLFFGVRRDSFLTVRLTRFF